VRSLCDTVASGSKILYRLLHYCIYAYNEDSNVRASISISYSEFQFVSR